MKKITLIILSSVLFSGLASAQVYFRAGGGYALPIATESVGQMQSRNYVDNGNNPPTNADKSKNVSASYGSGINFNAGGGFMFSEFFGVDLNVSYLMGKKYETGYKRSYDYGSYTYRDDNVTTTNSKAIFITPAFVITTGGAHAPYGRFGVVLGSPSINREESSYYDGDGTYTSFKKWEYKGGMSAGFQGSVGMNWTLGANLKLYTEVNFTSMTYYAKEYNLTKSTSDGVSDFDQIPVSQKKTEFVKEVDNTTQQDPTKPTQALRQGTPFSSLSLQVGVVYSIGGKNM